MTLLRHNVDDPEFMTELLRACRVSLAYDAQCEDGRGAFLQRLLGEIGGAGRWYETVAAALFDLPEPDDDLAQLFDLSCRLAAELPTIDHSRLHRHLVTLSFDDAVFGPMESLISLDGIDAFLLCVETFGDVLLEDRVQFGDGAFKSLIRALEDRDGAEACTRRLSAARVGSVRLDALLSRRWDGGDASGPRPASTYEAVRAGIAAGRAVPLRWGATASAEDLRSAAADMVREQDEGRRTLYVGIFAHCDYPGPPADLAPYVRSLDQRAAHRATQAMSRLVHPDVRALALALLDEGRYPERALLLLRKNFRIGDFARVLSVIHGVPQGEDVRHALGYALFGLIDERMVSAKEADTLLLWLYEAEPCSLCRARAAEALIASGSLTDAALEECLFDADGGTVRAAEAERARRRGTRRPEAPSQPLHP